MVDDVFFLSTLTHDPAPLRSSVPKQCKADLSNANASALLSWALHRLGPPHLSNAAVTGSRLKVFRAGCVLGAF